MHRAQPRIEIAPASIAIERHRKAALRRVSIRILDANHARIARARRFDSVGLHHVIVLLPNPALAADVGAGEKLLETFGEVVVAAEPNVLWHFARYWRFPARQRTFVHRRVVGERLIRNLGYDFAVVKHAQFIAGGDCANFDCIESPLFKDAEDFVLAAFLGDQQHALLRLAEHDFVCAHASFALRNAIEFDLDANAAARAHLAG